MKSLPLFTTKKEIFYTLVVIVALFVISFSYEYYKYKQITTYSLHVTTAKVLSDYQKDGKNYRILKLKSKDFTFYTTYKKPLHVNRYDELKVIFYTKGIDFYSYLRGFYASSKSLHVKKKSEPNRIVNFVENQHTNIKTKELYNALFFAIPISKELREDITKWGIAHLVAISGFHLGILSAILFFILKPIYGFFQDKYFPYRNQMADLALSVFILLGSYTYFIDMTPSVLRAFVMSLVGFFLFSRNIKIISFGTLFFTISIVLILFLFRFRGVFYISFFTSFF
jgi:competence protein ComEC